MRRMTVLLWLWVAIACLPRAHAAEPAPGLAMLVENFHRERRVAIGYLRTENLDLGAVALERLEQNWRADLLRLDTTHEAALGAAIAESGRLIVQSLAAADRGDARQAQALIERAAAPLRAYRKTRGYRIFADCIAEAGAAYERLDVFRLQPPDLAQADIAGRIVASSGEAAAALQRCDGEAAPAVRADTEFRRLVDGMLGSLRQVPQAVAARDNGYLHRLLIEQRSFERLLAFRFG